MDIASILVLVGILVEMRVAVARFNNRLTKIEKHCKGALCKPS